jgi:5'-nucleotidase
MSAAVEAAMEGIPSVGFSLCDYSWEADFTVSKHYAAKIIEQVFQYGLPRNVLLNVNIPKGTMKEVKGMKICRQAEAHWEEEFDHRQDPYGRDYYWLTGEFINHDRGMDTDEWALKNGYVSVVPVQYDLTAHHGINYINQNWDWDASSAENG